MSIKPEFTNINTFYDFADDVEIANSVAELDPGVRALIPTYLKNRKADLVELKSSLQSLDLDKIGRIAHKMKGSAIGYGQYEISDIAKRMYLAVGQQDWTNIEASIIRLDDYLIFDRY